MFVDGRLASLLAEAKREDLARSYKAANRRPRKEREWLFGRRAFLSRPFVSRLLPNR